MFRGLGEGERRFIFYNSSSSYVFTIYSIPTNLVDVLKLYSIDFNYEAYLPDLRPSSSLNYFRLILAIYAAFS